LPELGYAPDTGPMVGAKFTHRRFLDQGTALDAEATYALNQQQGLSLAIADPHLWSDQFLFAFRTNYTLDPTRRFFGLGNNDQGPDPASSHEIQDLSGTLTAGWRPLTRLSFNLTLGLRDVHIRHGNRLDECDGGKAPCPFTPVVFPDLPGVDGGMDNQIALSLTWNGRDDLVRPTRGWRAILKVAHTDKAVLSDFEFTRYVIDLGYLRSLFDRRLIGGLRLDGEWIDGPSGEVPFWELAELGGQDTMRGFFPHRFVGKGRVLMNGEIRFLITQFNFFSLWRVKLDGVVFGDGGRVFIDRTDIRDEFNLNSQIFDRIFSNFQYSYGGGVRIALSEALVARIDAGFSNEELGLIYLSFGQTF
jgi:outer membrane protein assembly factor BamA